MVTKVTQDVLAPTLNATNRIINGRFAIDQRNAGAAVTVSTSSVHWGPDRWWGSCNGGGPAFTLQREADSSYPGEYRLKIAVTVADASLAAADNYYVVQNIEGLHVADLNSGSANAQQLTLAFEVESTITGTFPVAFLNSALNRSYIGTFTVNAVNTRETKTITLTADTSGTWLADTGIGFSLRFGLAWGTTFQAGASNAWSAGTFASVAGMTNFMGTVGNTMRLKNVRLYKGAVDLGVDQRLYGQEFALCQRYYQEVYISGYCFTGHAQTTAAGVVFIPFVGPALRATPTVTMPTTGSSAGQATPVNSAGNIPSVIGTVTAGSPGVGGVVLSFAGFTGAWVAGGVAQYWGSSAEILVSAEL